MELVYTNAANTTIQATLDDKETLGNLTGPGVFYVPTDPANAEYQDIIANNYKVSPYEPPPVPEWMTGPAREWLAQRREQRATVCRALLEEET